MSDHADYDDDDVAHDDDGTDVDDDDETFKLFGESE